MECSYVRDGCMCAKSVMDRQTDRQTDRQGYIDIDLLN